MEAVVLYDWHSDDMDIKRGQKFTVSIEIKLV